MVIQRMFHSDWGKIQTVCPGGNGWLTDADDDNTVIPNSRHCAEMMS